MKVTSKYVYVLRDGDMNVLYVGASSNPMKRYTEHARRSWGDQIATITVTPCASGVSARELELQLIGELAPLHNIAGSERPSQPPGANMRILLEAFAANGPMTSTQCVKYLRDRGHDGSWVSSTIRAMHKTGRLIVVDEVPSIAGPRSTARVYGVPSELTEEAAA